jgi:hypothetical protein
MMAAKMSAWTIIAFMEVLPDIKIFFPTGGIVKRRPGCKRRKRMASNHIY